MMFCFNHGRWNDKNCLTGTKRYSVSNFRENPFIALVCTCRGAFRFIFFPLYLNIQTVKTKENIPNVIFAHHAIAVIRKAK